MAGCSKNPLLKDKLFKPVMTKLILGYPAINALPQGKAVIKMTFV